MAETFWNGQRTLARRGSAIVCDAPEFPRYWARVEGLVGQRIEVVEVTYGDDVFYLDNRGDEGWHKVTEGHGAPRWSHRNVSVTEFEPRA